MRAFPWRVVFQVPYFWPGNFWWCWASPLCEHFCLFVFRCLKRLGAKVSTANPIGIKVSTAICLPSHAAGWPDDCYDSPAATRPAQLPGTHSCASNGGFSGATTTLLFDVVAGGEGYTFARTEFVQAELVRTAIYQTVAEHVSDWIRPR